jgi:acyl-CoA reductase-like NAD-dependent aldehyde dehydrogenase
MRDSQRATNSGPGNVDEKELAKIAKAWGKLPEKERAAAMQKAFQRMPANYQDVIESYMKRMAENK